ncbi:hypothetical protein CVT26_005914 [Gymnopilus dilepis]|uniref:Uncharacterized protein n=1 Tax=Gymnopilus dilepis TaxID=231916 RepID=A0A409Y1Q8_9AGAR|nr:hypothetical protein CVT26_005914 [Gymnopilus dilepis]
MSSFAGLDATSFRSTPDLDLFSLSSHLVLGGHLHASEADAARDSVVVVPSAPLKIPLRVHKRRG